MTGLGLGLGISGGGTSAGGDVSYLYLLAQDGSVLQAQQNRGDDLSPSLILYEPNSVTSDALPDPQDLLLAQNGNILLTQGGRWIAQNASDKPYDRFITQGDKTILTQDGNFLVSTEVS